MVLRVSAGSCAVGGHLEEHARGFSALLQPLLQRHSHTWVLLSQATENVLQGRQDGGGALPASGSSCHPGDPPAHLLYPLAGLHRGSAGKLLWGTVLALVAGISWTALRNWFLGFWQNGLES